MSGERHFPFSSEDAALQQSLEAAKQRCAEADERWRSENYVRENDPAAYEMIGRGITLARYAVNGLNANLRDTLKSATALLWRVPLDPSDSETLCVKIEALHGALMEVEHDAASLEYPVSDLEPCLVSRELIADELEGISGQVEAINDGVDGLEAARIESRPGEIVDSLIWFTRESIGERSATAQILIDETQIDLSGVTNALASAAQHARDFNATLKAPSAAISPSIHKAGDAIERKATRAAAWSVKILKRRVKSVANYLETARRSATIWLDYAAKDAALMLEIAGPLQKAGFKLLLPAAANVDLYDFLEGRSDHGGGTRSLTADEKKLWALVAKSVNSATPRPLHMALSLISGAGGKDLAYAQELCTTWPRQITVASTLNLADTRRLRESHRSVISVRGHDEAHAMDALVDALTANLQALTRRA